MCLNVVIFFLIYYIGDKLQEKPTAQTIFLFLFLLCVFGFFSFFLNVSYV